MSQSIDNVQESPHILQPKEFVAPIFSYRPDILEYLVQRRQFWRRLVLLLDGGIAVGFRALPKTAVSVCVPRGLWMRQFNSILPLRPIRSSQRTVPPPLSFWKKPAMAAAENDRVCRGRRARSDSVGHGLEMQRNASWRWRVLFLLTFVSRLWGESPEAARSTESA